MAASGCITLALTHVFVWARRRDRALHLFFALSAAGAGGNAIAEAYFYQASTVEAFNVAFKWANSLTVLTLVFFLWFLIAYSQTWSRWRGLKLALTGVFVLAGVTNALLPYGFLFDSIRSLQSVVLPWGEVISLPEGPASPWRHIADVGFVGIFVVGVDCTRVLWRQGRRRGAALVGGSFLLFHFILLVSGLVTDLGIVPVPYLSTWAYFFVGLAMSNELAREVVRAGDLSTEVKANEKRWRSLLENVELLVCGVDRDLTLSYVNPHFVDVSGYEASELLGSSYLIVLPSGDQEQVSRDFDEVAQVIFEPHVERRLLTKSGEERQVRWSRVLLHDAQGNLTGLLAIGADVTEQRVAEKNRDEALDDTQKALAEVEKLKHRLEEEVVYLADELTVSGNFDEIIGDSGALKYVLRKVEQVAPLDATVLIEGETGVGKELFARAIHRRSPRGRRPLVKVNCASLPENLVEDELFGHERGAFTGATRLRKGRFELADGGTIFLDEIGELHPDLQGKLLRVLQEGEFERVGGDQTLKVNVRVIAATNRNLKEEVEARRFREDLFYRLHVYPITVPTLRQRKEDVPLLARVLVQRYARAQGKQIDEIPAAVMRELEAYDWPGNVRELENVLQRAVITSPNHTLRLTAPLSKRPTRNEPELHNGKLADVERAHIRRMLESSHWRIEGEGGAAKLLGLHPNTLRSRMRKLGITRPVAPPRANAKTTRPS